MIRSPTSFESSQIAGIYGTFAANWESVGTDYQLATVPHDGRFAFNAFERIRNIWEDEDEPEVDQSDDEDEVEAAPTTAVQEAVHPTAPNQSRYNTSTYSEEQQRDEQYSERSTNN